MSPRQGAFSCAFDILYQRLLCCILEKKESGDHMVSKEHISANLRLVHNDQNSITPIRTFSGVRHNLVGDDVAKFMMGIGELSTRLPTNAILTVRAQLKRA